MKAVVYENRPEWLIPAALIMLSLVPAAAGTVRLAELTGGADITPDNARFFASPLPVVLHILSVIPYSILGAFQFAPGFRRRRRRAVPGPMRPYCGTFGSVDDPILSLA
jgi:hypothetical protein